MKKTPLLTIAALCFSLPCFSKATKETKVFGNELMSFSSDGCSQFPDSIVGMDFEECCMEHDHAYWKGGTFEQKEIADNQLASCVGEKAFGMLGSSMKTGVGIGGGANLPTTWRWGYGWKINRGYQALSIEEEQRAEALFSQKPNDLELANPGIIPFREQVTGDYCLDIALKNILDDLEVSRVEYAISNERTRSNPEGFLLMCILKKAELKAFHVDVGFL